MSTVLYGPKQYRSKSIPLWRVIKEFENRTGVPVLLNTSFNRHGQPMVRSPEDAALHVVWGCVEYLIIHKYLVDANVKLEE